MFVENETKQILGIPPRRDIWSVQFVMATGGESSRCRGEKSEEKFASYVNLCQLGRITSTFEGTVDFCIEKGLLPKSVQCPKCACSLTKLKIRTFSAPQSRRPDV